MLLSCPGTGRRQRKFAEIPAEVRLVGVTAARRHPRPGSSSRVIVPTSLVAGAIMPTLRPLARHRPKSNIHATIRQHPLSPGSTVALRVAQLPKRGNPAGQHGGRRQLLVNSVHGPGPERSGGSDAVTSPGDPDAILATAATAASESPVSASKSTYASSTN